MSMDTIHIAYFIFFLLIAIKNIIFPFQDAIAMGDKIYK